MSSFPYMYDIGRRKRVPVRYMTLFPENIYRTMDPSNMDYFPKMPRRGSSFQVSKDRLELYLDMENYKAEELRVMTIEGFIIIEGQHKEKQDKYGMIQRQFYRRCPLPPGYKTQNLLSEYISDGTLYITAKLVKINGDEEVPVGSGTKDKEKVSGKTDQAVQVDVMEAGGSHLAEPTLEEVKATPNDQPSASGSGETSMGSIASEPIAPEKCEE